MKKGEKPQFSAQWWKTSKGSTVKDAGLEKALEAYEKAQTWLKFTKNTSTFDGARKALLALEPVVKKQIAACTAVVHAETIDVLKRFPPEIVKERARLEADAAEFDKNVAWVEQNFEMLTKAIAAIDKKLRAALADVDKRVVDFPAACKKGKGKQAKKDLASQNDVLEDLRQRFVEKDDNVEEMKKEQKELGVEGLTRVDWREPRAQCSNAMRDCDARLNAIRKTLAEFSDSDLEMLSTSYLKKLKQLTQAAVRLEGDVNSALGAARAEVKNLSKIPDEKTAAKRLADIAPHLEAAGNFRTQVASATRDMRDIDDDGDTAEGKAFTAAKSKLPGLLDKAKQIEDICKEYKRAVTERVAELRRQAAEDQRRKEEEAQRDVEANAEAVKYKKLTEQYVAKAKGWTAKAKEFAADADQLVKASDADGAVALLTKITANRELVARDRNAAGEIVNRDLPKSKLKQKQLAQQHLVFAKLTTELDNAYLKLDQVVVDLRKIPGVLGRA